MQTHELVQGSPQWIAHRNDYRNASDAPAMLNCSPYKTRNELIAERATGIVPEVDSYKQAIFDAGHLYEAQFRPHAEGIIGADLYPVVGTEGIYGASFDGLTLDELTGYEHKTLNDELRAVMVEGCTGADLPKVYRVQMEQQCMVAGCTRILFCASKWVGDHLEESRTCWYTPDEALRAEIIAGWAQFDADVLAYVPAEVVAKPMSESTDTLPAIAVQIEGRVVASNIPAFRERLASYIAGVNTNLVTDQDFANAEAAVKHCNETEARISATKEQVLGQVSTIDEVVRALDDAKAQLAKLRLHLDKEIKAKKQLLKDGIIGKAQAALKEHVAALEKEITPLTLVYQSRDFAGAAKGLKTIKSIQNAVDTELAAGKIVVDALAAAIRARHSWFKEVAAQYLALFPDLQFIIQKADDDFKLVVNTRIDKQKADDDAKLEADRKRQAELAAQVPTTAAEAVAQAKELAQAELLAPAVLGVDMATPGADQTVEVSLAGGLVTFKSDAEPGAVPTLKLGVICERLKFTVNAEFLAQLGFTATTEKGARLYHESEFPSICAALQRHIAAVASQF